MMKKYSSKFGVFSLVLILIGCAGAMTDTSNAEDHVDLDWLENRTSEHTRFAHNPFEREIAGASILTLTCAAIVERLGKALSREITKVQSRSGDYDPLAILDYDGFSIGVVDNGLGFSDSVIRYLEIVDNTEPLKFGIVIGETTRSDLIAIFSHVTLLESTGGLSMTAPAAEGDDRFDIQPTFIVVDFQFSERELLESVKLTLK